MDTPLGSVSISVTCLGGGGVCALYFPLDAKKTLIHSRGLSSGADLKIRLAAVLISAITIELLLLPRT